MKLRILLAVFLAGAGVALGADQPREQALVLYVAPDGNDAWSGRQATANAAKSDGPFATPDRAQRAIRDLKRASGASLRQPVVVRLRGGAYTLAEPLVFGPEDSGTAAAPVTWEAYENEKPVLSGGRRITGWKEARTDGKPLWAADLPDVRAGRAYFHELWVDSHRRVRARHPNQGFLQVAGVPDAQPGGPRNRGQDQFQFAPGDLKAWDNLQDVDVVALHLWVSVRLPVVSVDETNHLTTFAARSHRPLVDNNQPARYYVENAFELLDTPGEWYLNRKTGTLHYWPLPGEDLAKADVIAPVLPQLVRLEGKPEAGRYVEHLTFRGLTFEHAETWPARNDPGDVQASASLPAAVQGNGVRHCSWEACTVAHAGGYGIHLARGCQHNRITGCEVFDLGGGGIKVGEMAIRDDPSQQTHDTTVSDNHVHDLGRIFHQSVGIWVGQSYGNRLAHNHIHDLYYTGISAGWTWGYGKTLAHDNVIEFNHVHDLGKEWLSDMGGIYTLGVQPGTVVRSNVFHDIAARHYGGWGIYFDEGSTHILAENNLVYRTTHGGFHQHYGRENTVRNNIFAFGRDAQLQRTRPEPHVSFTFEHNIVYYTEGKLLAGRWDDDRVALDHNVYWKAGGGEIRFGNLTWDPWRAKGRDEHSLIADPLFQDAAKADFGLRPESPAVRLGFRPFDLQAVGLAPSAPRPSR